MTAATQVTNSSNNLIFDLYGFEHNLTPQQLRDRQESQAQAEKHEEAWRPYAARHALPSEGKLKKLIRKGIPPNLRAWVWEQTSGAAKLKANQPSSYYRNLVAASGQLSNAIRQIELDLPRTYPKHQWLRQSEAQGILRRVLTAFSVHNPAVGYCQGLNFVAGLLLVAVERQEELTFWLLVSLVDKILYPGTHAANLAGCHVEMRTLDNLVATKLPALHRHMESLCCNVTIIAADWFLCLFCNNLAPEVTLRIWDALFHEGAKILFRVSLALLKLHEPQLLKYDNPGCFTELVGLTGELMKAIRDSAAGYHNACKLMKVAFDDIGSLPMARVEQIRGAQQTAVQAMLTGREITSNH